MFPALHPQTVHFPIAFLVLAGIFYVVPFFSADSWFRRGGLVLHIAGLAGMVLAIITGTLAEAEIVHTARIDALYRNHELLGYAALWLFAMLLVWRYLREKQAKTRENVLFVFVFWAMIGVTGYSAHLGGKMVYEEGAGVAPMEEILNQQLHHESRSRP